MEKLHAVSPSRSRYFRRVPRISVLIGSVLVAGACGDSAISTGDSTPIMAEDSLLIEETLPEDSTPNSDGASTAVFSAYESRNPTNESNPVAGDSEIWSVTSDGSNLRNLTDNDVDEWDPILSPDGTRIVFRRSPDNDTETFAQELWVMDTDGGNQRRVVEGLDVGGDSRSYSWSPDGRTIAASAIRRGIDPVDNGVGAIYIVDIDTGEASILVNTDNSDLWPAWSPDGSRIAFVKSTDNLFELYVIGIDGLNLTQLTEGTGVQSFPSWSRDSTSVVITSFPGELPRILSIDVETGVATRLDTNDGFDAKVSPDGTKIVYWTRTASGVELWVMSIDGSAPAPIFRLQDEVADPESGSPVTAPAWSPDSTHVMFSFFGDLLTVDPQLVQSNDPTAHLRVVDVTGTRPPIKIADGLEPFHGSMFLSWSA